LPDHKNRLEGEDRKKALERLAKRLDREALPPVVADNLDHHALRDAYLTNDEVHWGEVEEEAQKLLDVYYDPSDRSRPPGRGDERGAPDEVALKPPENVTERAEALAEIMATLCTNHPQVRQFRRINLRGRLLTDEEAREFLDKRGGPHGTNKAAHKNGPARRWLLGEQGGLYQTPIDMKKLLRLAEKLSSIYPWREGDALWFVLTGYVPPIRPLEVWLSAPQFSAKPGHYHPTTAQITVTAHAWVGAEAVDRAFRDAQRQVLGGDSYPPIDERTMEVVKFVARRRRERNRVTWEALRKEWNETCPEKWRYKNYRVFRQVCVRFMERYMYRTYNQPNYELRERTPFEEYRDVWNNRVTGRREKRACRLAAGHEMHQ
jgi:hypothetical protein